MMRSSVASRRENSPTSVPLRMTRIRSLMPRISGSSDEMNRTASPSPASRSMIACTSALAPTSIPRVGSSRISTFGGIISQRPMTIFCWLPPLSVETCTSCEAARMASVSIIRWTSTYSRALLINPIRLNTRSARRERFVRTGSIGTSPRTRRSSGVMAIPCAMASRGDRMPTRAPSIRMSPSPAGASPKRASATAVRPDPMSP